MLIVAYSLLARIIRNYNTVKLHKSKVWDLVAKADGAPEKVPGPICLDGAAAKRRQSGYELIGPGTIFGDRRNQPYGVASPSARSVVASSTRSLMRACHSSPLASRHHTSSLLVGANS